MGKFFWGFLFLFVCLCLVRRSRSWPSPWSLWAERLFVHVSLFGALCVSARPVFLLGAFRLVSPSPGGRRRFSWCVFFSWVAGFVFLLFVFFWVQSQDPRGDE